MVFSVFRLLPVSTHAKTPYDFGKKKSFLMLAILLLHGTIIIYELFIYLAHHILKKIIFIKKNFNFKILSCFVTLSFNISYYCISWCA